MNEEYQASLLDPGRRISDICNCLKEEMIWINIPFRSVGSSFLDVTTVLTVMIFIFLK
jgi:hypothetical protein